jgi:hypothetical protein
MGGGGYAYLLRDMLTYSYMQSLLKPEELMSLLDYHRRQSTNQMVRTSLQSVINLVGETRKSAGDVPSFGESLPRRKSTSPEDNLEVKRSPTEADLETGCFTDVSFAGTFAQAQPEESLLLMEDTDGGCFTEVSFAGTFARHSLEPPGRRLEDGSAVTVSQVTVSRADTTGTVATTTTTATSTLVEASPAASDTDSHSVLPAFSKWASLGCSVTSAGDREEQITSGDSHRKATHNQ